jgi:hypothetical protein
MKDRHLPRLTLLLVTAFAGTLGCADKADVASPAPGKQMASPAAPATAPATAAQMGHFTGRITFADGSPITLPDLEYEITIAGVTAVGENNVFKPSVGPDGTFKLRLPEGLFKPPYGTIMVPFEGKKYSLWLDPVEPFKGTRESSSGIAQNFVWRLTGPRPHTRNPDVNNATHWFGSSIRLIPSSFRNDIGQKVTPLADGSKIAWTLKPTSKVIDGSDGKTLTVERAWRTNGSGFDLLNDLPAANYEISAVATLPDGSTKTLLLTDLEDNRYKPTAKMVLEPEEAMYHYVYLPRSIEWAAE